MSKNTCLLRAVLTIALACTAGACGVDDRRVVIQNKGSDSLLIVAQAWAEAYHEINNPVMVAVAGGGSGAGFNALLNGTADIANASRAMRPEEIARLEETGQRPVQHVVGYDALAVFVHGDNPVSSLTLEQLAEIFADNGAATTWSDLGVEVPGCRDQVIVLVGRQNNSGSYAYFKQAVLGKDHEYKLDMLHLQVSKDVVELVANTPCAIGYGGMAYVTGKVNTVCLAVDETEACVQPSVASAVDGSYPVARPLFMYSTGESQAEVNAYLDWVTGEQGQCILLEKGYAPAAEVSCS
jgi:phosphate transport system substrate-binding protein